MKYNIPQNYQISQKHKLMSQAQKANSTAANKIKINNNVFGLLSQ